MKKSQARLILTDTFTKYLTQASRFMRNSQTATTLYYLRNVNNGSDMLKEIETALAVLAPNRTK